MVKYRIKDSEHRIIVNSDQDDLNQKHYVTVRYEWNSQTINEIFDSCLGPNKISMASDTVLDGPELQSMLRFVLGPDKLVVRYER